MASDAKWQLGFWVITIICGSWLSGLTIAIAANDIRNTENHSVMLKDRTILLNEFIHENNAAHQEIVQRLARIEAILKNAN